MSIKVDICVPLYNEELNLPDLIKNFKLAKEQSKNINKLVLVDNGSIDKTWDMLEKYADQNLQIHHLPMNLGYGGGAQSAISFSSSDKVALIPANNQYKFTEIVKLIEFYCKTVEDGQCEILVKGWRVDREDPIFTRILSIAYTGLTSLLIGKLIRDVNGLPKIFDKTRILEISKNFPKNATFDSALLYECNRLNIEIYEFPVSYLRRIHGQPSWARRRIKVGFCMLGAMIRYRLKR